MPKTRAKRQQSVAIIGAGRLGTALAIALARHHYLITTLVGTRIARTKKSAALFDAAVRVLAEKDISKIEPADLIFVTTPDDQIESLAKALSLAKVDEGNLPTVFHTSGALSSSVLSDLSKRGWQTGSMHPLVSVSDAVRGATAFNGAYWCLEGDRKALQTARTIVRDLGGFSFSVSTDCKPLYHSAAVMSSGNVVALFATAIDMLSQCGLTRTEARKVLLPLLASTAANLDQHSPEKALTGTFARGDMATVKLHLQSLASQKHQQARKIYELLGLKSLELKKADGLDPKLAKLIADKLSD
jgi:predicted short-subunit dehydrogenase-like oxidoreductase (DUF2520 family)